MANGEIIGNGKYTINKISNVKDYCISQINYYGAFGTKDVLSATGNGNERFYVMTVTDFNSGTLYCWYDAALGNMHDYASVTSGDFGTGKNNTQIMIEKWKNSVYGPQNNDEAHQDIWGKIQAQVNDGWFIPSRGEWSAFGEELGITKENYKNKSLFEHYWSSSQGSEYYTWNPNFPNNFMTNSHWRVCNPVRLSTTF